MNTLLHRNVLEDLEYLHDTWRKGQGDNSKLRRDSTTLRKLLLGERLLIRTWNEVVGQQPYTVYAPVMPDFEKEMPSLLEGMAFYGLGGAYQGLGDPAASIRRGPTDEEYEKMSDEERAEFHAVKGPVWWPMTLTKFVSNRCLIVDGRLISRAELITFVANKLGGAHFDARRSTAAELALDLLMSDQLMIGGRQALYFELLSIVQDLIGSPDTVKLIEILKAQS